MVRGSGQCLTEESYLANKIFKAGFKTNNVDGNPRLCMASAVGGYTTTFGKDEPMGTYADIDRASTFFIIGSNTSEAHPVLFRRIARRKQNEPGVKIIVADPRRTNTSRIGRPAHSLPSGTDLALMNGMAWVFCTKNWTIRVSITSTQYSRPMTARMPPLTTTGRSLRTIRRTR